MSDFFQTEVSDSKARTHIGQLLEEISISLQSLVSQQEARNELESNANDWRQVARVIDRLLFVIFLFIAIAITLWFAAMFLFRTEKAFDE